MCGGAGRGGRGELRGFAPDSGHRECVDVPGRMDMLALPGIRSCGCTGPADMEMWVCWAACCVWASHQGLARRKRNRCLGVVCDAIGEARGW